MSSNVPASVTRKLKLINFLSVSALVFLQFTTTDDWDIAYRGNPANTTIQQKILTAVRVSGVRENGSVLSSALKPASVSNNLRTSTYVLYRFANGNPIAPGTTISLAVKTTSAISVLCRIYMVPASVQANVFPFLSDVDLLNLGTAPKGISVASLRFPAGSSGTQFAADFSKGLSSAIDLSVSVSTNPAIPPVIDRITSSLLNTNPTLAGSEISDPYNSTTSAGARDTQTYNFPVILSDQFVSPGTINNADPLGIPFSQRVLMAADVNDVTGYNSKTPLHYHASLRSASALIVDALATTSPSTPLELNSLLWWIRNQGVPGLGWKFDDFYSSHPSAGYIFDGQVAPIQAVNPPSLTLVTTTDADAYHFLSQPMDTQEMARAYGSGRVTVWRNANAGAPGFAPDTADPSETWWTGNNGFSWLPSTGVVASVPGNPDNLLTIAFRNVGWVSGVPDVSAAEVALTWSAGVTSSDSPSWWNRHWGKIAIGVGILLILGLFLLALLPGARGGGAEYSAEYSAPLPKLAKTPMNTITFSEAEANTIRVTDKTSYPLIGKIERFGPSQSVISGPKLTQETSFSAADASASKSVSSLGVSAGTQAGAQVPDWLKFQNYATPVRAETKVEYPSFFTSRY